MLCILMFVSMYARGFHQLIVHVIQETAVNRQRWTKLPEVGGAVHADVIITHSKPVITGNVEPLFSACYHQFQQWENDASIQLEMSSSVDCAEIRPDGFCGKLMRMLMFLICRSHPLGLQVDVHMFSPVSR